MIMAKDKSMEAAMKTIIDELRVIRAELSDIKESMPDRDMFLTPEEKRLVEESYDNEKKGKLISLESFKKTLRL
jgi:hypothetical protein